MKPDCRNFDKCAAPLCPMLPDAELKALGWISNEDICTIREFARYPWIKRQRAIQKKADPEHPNEIKGELRLYKVDELSKKPKRKPMTEEQKNRLKNMGFKKQRVVKSGQF